MRLRKICFLIVMLFVIWGYFSINTGMLVVHAQNDYTVSGKKITVNVKKNTDIVKAVNNAIDYARQKASSKKVYTVKVPKGTYKLSGTIHVYGNMILDFTGVTLNYTSKEGNMLMSGDISINDSKEMKGYGNKKYHNITIKGGTWNGNSKNDSALIRMTHSKNITFEGCVLSGGGCPHQMEVVAIDGFIVKKCTFKDLKGTGKGEQEEALQLDMPCSSKIFQGVTVLDGTPMKNVTITECTFKNVPRGVGTHSMLMGTYYKNMKITNNKFINVAGYSIVTLNYYNCTISGNTITNCGAGIFCQYFKPEVRSVFNTIYNGKKKVSAKILHDSKTTITNNTIKIVSTGGSEENVGIKVHGLKLTKATKATGKVSNDTIPKGDYYISNVTITNNQITTCGYGIHLMDTKSSVVSNNKIKNTKSNSKKDGILLEAACEKITLQKNTIQSPSRYGIYLQGKSTANSITNNKITSAGIYGIGLYDSSKVIGKINNNTISDSKNNGIFLNKNSTAKEISSNKITNSGNYGISLYDSSTVSGKITSNVISKSKSNSIFLNKNSSATEISNNTITDSGKYAIGLYDSSKVTDKISKNIISGSASNGICLNENCTAKEISDNTITDSGKSAIELYNSSEVIDEIFGNITD